MTAFDLLIVGGGLAGTTVGWAARWAGLRAVIVDRGEPVTASRVAAGLMTPVTGKRFAVSWRWPEVWPTAVAFYRRAEADTGATFFHPKGVVRLFAGPAEAVKLGSSPFARPLTDLNADWFAAPHGGVEMPAAGQLDVPAYLDASRRVLDVVIADGDPSALVFDDTGVSLPALGVSARRVVFCQGVAGMANPWTAGLAWKAAKGEVLTLRVPGLAEDRVVNRGVWLARIGGDTYRAGSTYEWDDLTPTPTAAGRASILSRLSAFLRLPVEVVGHAAGVRPVIDAGRPCLGVHPAGPRVAVFNGLGAKGAVLAPYFAGQLVRALAGDGGIDPEVDVRRFLGGRS